MHGSSSIIGDAKYQELKMSFEFRTSGQNLVIIAHANNESYEGQRVFDPDFDFEDIKEDLINKQFKIVSHTNEILKLKVGKYVNLQLKNIPKIQAASFKEKLQDLTKLLNIQVEKNNSLQKATLQLRTQMDLMTTKMADLMQLVSESYTINKNLKNELNGCKQTILVLELEKKEETNKLNEIKSLLNSQKRKVDAKDEQIKQIHQRLNFQQQNHQNLQIKVHEISGLLHQQEEQLKKNIQVQTKINQDNKKYYQQFQKGTKAALEKLGILSMKQKLEFMGKSKIVVSSQEDRVLRGFFGPIKNLELLELKLLYRASQNNFSAHKFHEKCDGIKNTIVLVQTEFNKKIGGFTPLTWQNIDSDTFAPKADMNCQSFIFSLSNKDKLILSQYNREYAIKNRKGYGPSFGSDDLTIFPGADKGQYSMANIGFAYQNINYKCKEKKSWEMFCGNPNNSNKFKIVEWEVWEVVFKV